MRRAGGRGGLCQALEVARREDFDYGDKHGVEISSIYGIGKMLFGSGTLTDTGDLKQHGVVTGYFATTN